MSETTRPCLVCGEGASAEHDDHAYEPANPTPDEAAALVAAIAEEHGADVAYDTAQAIADEAGADSEVAKAAYGAAEAAAEADREDAEAERAAIAAKFPEVANPGGWQLPAPARGWVLTEDEEAAIRNAQ